MALTNEQRIRAWQIFFRLTGSPADTWGKTLLSSTADAVVAWKDANAAAYNTALPVGFRGAGSTTDEKAAMLIAVLAAERGLEL
jgi:hypothetical protein